MTGIRGVLVAVDLLLGLASLSFGLMLVALMRHVRGGALHRLRLALCVFVLAGGLSWLADALPPSWHTARLLAALRAVTALAVLTLLALLAPRRGMAALAQRLRRTGHVAEALRLTDEHFRLIVEGVQDHAIYMLDPEGRVVSWSPGATRLKGYEASEAVGLHFSAFYPPEAVAEGRPARGLAIAEREGRYEEQGWRQRKDGERFWADVVITALRGSRGELLGFAKVARDITDRMRADLLVRERGQRIESLNLELAALIDTLFECAPIGLGSLDIEGRFVRINRRLAEVTGLPSAEQLGRRLTEALPEIPQAAAALQRVIVSGEAELGVEIGGEAPGGRRDWLWSYYPVLAGGVSAGVGVIVEEITERKRTEAHQARLLEQAQEGVRSRDVFMAVAAHELKTPLTPLTLEVDGLLRAVRLGRTDLVGATGVERLKVIRRQVARLERLIGDLLDVSRLAAGRLELVLEELDLAAVAQEVVARHTDELARAGCVVTVSVGGPAVGRWDRARVDQILTNLLTNATKYGAGRPIELAVAMDGAAASLRVRDHGIGIAPADQERIFARFERAAPVRHYSGLGLGLWIARQAAGAMGGALTVESELERGATFTLTLPSRRADPASAPGPATTGGLPCHPSS